MKPRHFGNHTANLSHSQLSRCWLTVAFIIFNTESGKKMVKMVRKEFLAFAFCSSVLAFVPQLQHRSVRTIAQQATQEDGEQNKESTEEETSAAMNWAKEQQQEQQNRKEKGDQKKYVVVGAGWGGWGAAKSLCESGAHVTLIDALPDPTGRTPYLSESGKPVEPGTRGFWKDYPNINALCDELGLENVFTHFTNSSFYSPDGLEATAPVFSNAQFPEDIPFLSNSQVPSLPSPLGQIMATFPLFERLPLSDRASMAGLLVATIDCLGGDEKVQQQYDRMTAHELFLRFGLSSRLVQDFLKPTLLVGLFKPPEELSALVVMELLYYYALAHMDSFDVRWIRNGTVSDSLLAPLASYLEESHDLQVLGNCRVGEITVENSRVTGLEYSSRQGQKYHLDDVDGIILALGGRGMQSVLRESPGLARYLPNVDGKGIDVMSCRLWLDRKVATRTPANVWANFEELRGAGGTFFMLDQLQEDNPELWGQDEPQGSVVACDFYNAGALMSLNDEELVDTLINKLLPAAVSDFGKAQVVDSWVGRYDQTVTWFSPGSWSRRPTLQIEGLTNVKCAGDWVKLGEELEKESAKGLCQERAYASGLHAGNSLLRDTCTLSKAHSVLPVRPDETQFQAGVTLNNQVMKFLPRFWVR